ncbi:hypothetical protein HO173_012021 [Letharia columbiana]|uniref:NACHT domain-containing protein n=1 Tax=Letharia columbiana TaxID=112416 RepID=A0A8H6FGW5_9LECA|nr:uncharacterized protein HO173_012021 [Letharia columbiana]KAF6227691.1 hypothetical protein HO173_012021 [Letharia columbiana]
MIPTGPEDVVNEIEKWHERHSDSKVAAGVRGGLVRLQRFSASIDMLAQGTPSPGCLLWGSIKFVLTIVQDAAEAYEQLCKALTRMIDCLPRIELYTETFLDSSLVAHCVNAFYVSIIGFWAKACKFYRRRRLWNFLRVIWNDFNTEFSDLEFEMIRNRDRVESAALAEHIGESKVARVNQKLMSLEILHAQSLTRRKEITAWLAPAAYDVEYYSNDLASARALRHPKTCIWVLDKTEVMQLCDTSHRSGQSLLWICANPGAGKTILSSFLIDHFESEEPDPARDNVFYFFCKNTDVDKNTPAAIIRSLLYQLYKSVKGQVTMESLNDDLGLALDRSGQQRAVNFAVLWQLFSTHVKNLTPATIILDALDECQDPSRLIQGLIGLSTLRSIKVIVTSRKESHLHNELKNVSSIEIAPEDINADIAAYVEAKIEASSRLSHPLVRDLVFTKLCNAHDGMFLWVYLMLKELKSCFSMVQVQDALAKLPTGLDGIYKSILQRLQTTLTRSSFDLCSKVLIWVVTAVVGSNLVLSRLHEGLTSLQRPLGIDEIKQALTLHYEMDGDTLLTDDRSFPYSDKDVELICGSLVTIRKGTLQVIHLTVKEFLRSRHKKDRSAFSSLLVDPERGSLQLTLVCLRCVATNAEPLVDLGSSAPQIDWAFETDTLDRCQARAPLLEYASFSWLVHLIDCKLDDLLEVTPTFEKTFNSPATFSWVETCMASQPDTTLRLSVGVDEVRDRFYGSREDPWPRQEASSRFLASWCIAMSRVFEEYGGILARRPWEIYVIDLCDIFSVDPSLRKLWQEHGETPLRKKDLHLNKYRAPHPPQVKPQPHHQLQRLHIGSSNQEPVFLVHDEGRNVYIWGETMIRADNQAICVQHDETGHRLPPAEEFGGGPDQIWRLIDLELSPSGGYLALVYITEFPSSNAATGIPRELTVVWKLDENMSFKRRMNCEPWARVVFRIESSPALFMDGSRAVMFKDDRHCVTPSGMLDLLTGSRRPLPDGIRDYVGSYPDMFYSCDGQYLFSSVPDAHESSGEYSIQARRVDPFKPSPSVNFSWEDKRRYLVDVSPTGRYLVLGVPFGHLAFNFGEEILYLYDTDSKKLIELRFPEPLNYWEGKFLFTRHETRLISFLLCHPSKLHVMIWDCLATAPRLTSHATSPANSHPDLVPRPYQIHVHKAATSAVMVTNARSIQRIELGDEIKFLDANKMIDDYSYRLSTVSRDGSHWALVCYGRKGGKVQIIDLTSPDAPARHFDLEWSQSDIPRVLTQGTNFPIGFSPDLRVLIINAEVFDITTTEGDDLSKRLTLTPFTMEALPTLLEPHRHKIPSWGLDCQISACNSYVIYMGRGDQWGDTSRYSSAIFLYRIDLQKRKSARLELILPEGLISLNASLHPSLPLMTISYASPTSTELEDIRERAPPLRLAIFDLMRLEKRVLENPKGQATKAMAESWRRGGFLPRLLFSDSGEFAYLEGRGKREEWWFQSVYQMDINPVPSRFICGSISLDNSLVIFHDGNNVSVALELIKFDDNGFWIGTRPAVVLRDIAAYSSHSAVADRYLLLGANDDEKMRLLIAPTDGRTPVIKTLSLTFAEARARLEKEWQRLHANSQDQDLSETV